MKIEHLSYEWNNPRQIKNNFMPSVFIFWKHLKWNSNYDDWTLKVANMCNKIGHITYHIQMLPVIQINRKKYSACLFYDTVLFNISPLHSQPGSLWVNLYFLWKFGNVINTFFLRYKINNNKFILIMRLTYMLINPLSSETIGGQGWGW